MQALPRFSLPIALAAVCGLLVVHFGDAARWPVVLGLCALVVWAVRDPAAGVLATLPLVLIIQPTPTVLSWRELGFAVVLAVAGLASLWQARTTLPVLARQARWAILCVLIVAVANATMAAAYDVTASDWLRGAIPFVFLLYLLPVFLESRREEAFASAWWWAAIVTAALFSWQIVSYFVVHQLWNPYSYVYEQGRWLRLDPEALQATAQQVFEFKARVTQLVQPATDALVPLGYVLGAWAALSGRTQRARGTGFALLILATVAMILTYTRSMLLAAWAVGGLLMLHALLRGAWIRVAAAGLITLSAAAITIVACDLEDVYWNRLFLTRQAIMAVTGGAPGAADDVPGAAGAAAGEAAGEGAILLPEDAVKDANVSSRMEEYRTAWQMFADSPILGQGLGVRHTISFETGHGDLLTVHVGYVHNWIFYILMVGGVVGLVAYSFILFGPALLALRSFADAREVRPAIVATALLLALYACFFAVFRLISFNLVLGGLWGLVLASRYRSAIAQGRV